MEKQENFKGMNIILTFIAVITVVFLVICVFITSSKQKNVSNYMEKTENIETSEQAKSNTISINTDAPNQLNTALKFDLKNNELSNFDIAFLKLENKKENKIYSPLSIKYTLKMLEEGSSGTTKLQISNVLKDYNITKYTSSKNMSLANALFVRDTFKDSIKQSYVTKLNNKYNAEIVYDSFASAKNVNDWVKSKTLGIIPEILDEIDKDEDFLLINALGIDMEWKNKFTDVDNNYNKGFRDFIEYNHENYYGGCFSDAVCSRKFDNNKLEVSGMEIFASMDNYDIVSILGEDNIRKTVEEKYREWIKQNGTNSWGEALTDNAAIENEISNYLDDYIEDLKINYTAYGESKSIDFSLYTDNDVKVFAKDLKEYDGTTLQYIGIMPTDKLLDEYVKSIDGTKLNKIINNLKELKRENFKDGVITRIKGFIPKFNFEYTLKLKDDLADLGIKDVFAYGKADISELCSANGEYISDAIHKANIEFTQDGIKAAAATMVGGKGAGGPAFDYIYDVPIEDIDLTFDKPYMFIIRDKNSGDVWFVGTVYEPLAWEDDATRADNL